MVAGERKVTFFVLGMWALVDCLGPVGGPMLMCICSALTGLRRKGKKEEREGGGRKKKGSKGNWEGSEISIHHQPTVQPGP